MPIETKKFIRKPFTIEAIEVTRENIAEVAAWCGGQLRTSDLSKRGGREGFQQYIKVEVKKPLNDRQTRAYVGDWVTTNPGDSGYKVYTPKAFTDSYDELVEHMVEVINRMDERAAEELRAEEQEESLFPEELPGVRRTYQTDPVRL
jgi:hypothetical protein